MVYLIKDCFILIYSGAQGAGVTLEPLIATGCGATLSAKTISSVLITGSLVSDRSKCVITKHKILTRILPKLPHE